MQKLQKLVKLWAGSGPFEIPQEIYKEWDAKEAGKAKEAWDAKLRTKFEYAAQFPELAAEFKRRMPGGITCKLGKRVNSLY